MRADSAEGARAIRAGVQQKAGTPDHPIVVEAAPVRVRVTFAGRVVADSDDALVLTEASYPPAYYLPKDAVDPAVLEPSTRTSRCPFKGEATYHSLCVGDRVSPDAVWCYETPLEAVSAIAGHVAFYRDRVDGIEEIPRGAAR